MWGRGGGGREGGGEGLGLKSDVFFGLQVDEPLIGGVPIYMCVWGEGGGTRVCWGFIFECLYLCIYILCLIYIYVFIFYYRSPFSEESLRCLVAVDL